MHRVGLWALVALAAAPNPVGALTLELTSSDASGQRLLPDQTYLVQGEAHASAMDGCGALAEFNLNVTHPDFVRTAVVTERATPGVPPITHTYQFTVQFTFDVSAPAFAPVALNFTVAATSCLPDDPTASAELAYVVDFVPGLWVTAPVTELHIGEATTGAFDVILENRGNGAELITTTIIEASRQLRVTAPDPVELGPPAANGTNRTTVRIEFEELAGGFHRILAAFTATSVESVPDARNETHTVALNIDDRSGVPGPPFGAILATTAVALVWRARRQRRD